MDRVNQIFTKIGRAVALLTLTFIVAFAAFTAQALPGPTSATFAKGAKFTVAGYAADKPALSGFPVLVRIFDDSPSGFHYNEMQHANATDKDDIDIAFVGMDGTGLPFEIDTWNPSGTSLIWVRLPTMTNGTEFVMCWGSDSSGKEDVCDDSPFADYVGVWHMSEASDNVADSSGHSLTAMPSNVTTSNAASGRIGNGRQCDTGGYLSIANAGALDVGDTFAVSGWFSMAPNLSGDLRFFSRKIRNQTTSDGWEVIRKGAAIAVRGASGDNIASYAPEQSFAGAGWKHLFIVYNGNTATIYEDGEQKASATAGTAPVDNDKSLSIGSYSGGASSYFIGSVDECRLLDATPSADWAKAEFDSMNNAGFLTPGEAEDYEETGDPVAGVRVSDVDYTNATVSVSISSFGGDATSADVTVQVATSNDFAAPVWSTNYTATQTGERSFVAYLSYGTTYYVRAVLDNGGDGEPFATSVATFTTLAPGAAVGSATFLERGFTTMSASATATAFGTGSESATIRLEASTDGFATVIAGAESPATAGEPATVDVSGLTPGTEYALRVRIRNEWSVDKYIALPDAYTRDVPFAATGIGWDFSADGSTIEITFGVSGVYDGATGSATLYYGESADPTASQGANPVNTTGDLSWPSLPVTASTMYAKVVLSATLGGTTYTKTYTAPLTAGSTSVAVSDIMNHASAATAVRVRPGDVVTLPELSGTARYIVGNKLFGSLDGNVLTALRPGIVGIHCIGNDSTTNTLAVLVLPEKIGNGGIYIFKESSISGNNNGLWCSAESWEKVGAETNDSYPQNPDDIAIIPYYSLDSRSINLGGDVAVGELYVGGYCDNKAYVTLGTNNSSYKRKLSLCREDGKMAIVQLCSSSLDLGNNAYRATLKFSDGLALVSFLVDTTLSGGWDGTDPRFPQGRFEFSAPTNHIADGVTVTLVEMDTQGLSYNQGTLSLGNLAGAGTFWNRSSGLVRYSGGSSSFTGLVRCSGGHNAGGESHGRTGPAYFRTTSLTNAAAEVVGWVGSNGQDPQSEYKRGVGALYTGYPHFHEVDKPHRSYFPARGATMHGGYIINRYIGSGAWTNSAENSITRDVKRTDFLCVEAGFNFLYGDANSDDHPGNDFIADALVHENKATLRINDSSRYSLASSVETPRQTTVLHGVSAFAVGEGEDPEQSPAYSIVPWIVGPVVSGDDNYSMMFGCFDAADRYIRPDYSSKALSEWGALDNAVVWTKDMTSITLDADKTLNSLVLDNSGISSSDKCLGDGRKLTIASGGLVFTKSGASVGTENGGTANGTLVLGDATHPAYVWARGSAESPNHIWAKVSASGGFVSAYTGNLILGGDQTGIGDEIAVNAGSLQLGSSANSCQLAKDLPIRIYANATLKLPNASSTTGNILKFDGAAGWFGKVEVPKGVAAKCRKAYWRDYPESPEWQNIKRGIFTGDEATALATGAIYDPDRFTGAGTLEVLKDDITNPLILRIR